MRSCEVCVSEQMAIGHGRHCILGWSFDAIAIYTMIISEFDDQRSSSGSELLDK